jgi:hypothetical protein
MLVMDLFRQVHAAKTAKAKQARETILADLHTFRFSLLV